MKLVAVDELMVFYENALALNNVCLEVGEGEIVGIVGSNGAGKSTLMYTISGIMLDRKVKEERRGGERITMLGRITHRGESIAQLPPWERVKRGVVLCPERRRVFPESSVIENLRIGAHTSTRARAADDLRAVWNLFPSLHDMRDRPAGFLSGGQQQMLAIGRALMARPSLFLIDEPLLGLSPPIQLEVIDAIRSIRNAGVTVIIAEQYARPLFPILDRGYVLESGSITLSGTGEELLANPHVRAAYFGE